MWVGHKKGRYVQLYDKHCNVIEDEQGNNIGRFYCPYNAMHLSVEMMEEKLLNLQKLMKFEIYMTDNAIKGIEHVWWSSNL